MYAPPGTGKTLLAQALVSNIQATFLKVVASAIVNKYIGESARIIREMFGFARDHEPCVIFMDKIDAIGGSRFSEGTSADREIQRTLIELLNQMDWTVSNSKDKSKWSWRPIILTFWTQPCSDLVNWIGKLKFPNQTKPAFEVFENTCVRHYQTR